MGEHKEIRKHILNEGEDETVRLLIHNLMHVRTCKHNLARTYKHNLTYISLMTNILL